MKKKIEFLKCSKIIKCQSAFSQKKKLRKCIRNNDQKLYKNNSNQLQIHYYKILKKRINNKIAKCTARTGSVVSRRGLSYISDGRDCFLVPDIRYVLVHHFIYIYHYMCETMRYVVCVFTVTRVTLYHAKSGAASSHKRDNRYRQHHLKRIKKSNNPSKFLAPFDAEDLHPSWAGHSGVARHY